MEIAMWIADNWKDYEVIDCSKGEKLGALGRLSSGPSRSRRSSGTRRRPSAAGSKMNGHYHRSAKGGGEWEFFDLPQQWTIHYKAS